MFVKVANEEQAFPDFQDVHEALKHANDLRRDKFAEEVIFNQGKLKFRKKLKNC